MGVGFCYLVGAQIGVDLKHCAALSAGGEGDLLQQFRGAGLDDVGTWAGLFADGEPDLLFTPKNTLVAGVFIA